jgi:hypothetical protein
MKESRKLLQCKKAFFGNSKILNADLLLVPQILIDFTGNYDNGVLLLCRKLYADHFTAVPEILVACNFFLFYSKFHVSESGVVVTDLLDQQGKGVKAFTL